MVARLTRKYWMSVRLEFKPCWFFEPETLPSLLSTGWFQEQIGA